MTDDNWTTVGLTIEVVIFIAICWWIGNMGTR
jgi:hypothetical protein